MASQSARDRRANRGSAGWIGGGLAAGFGAWLLLGASLGLAQEEAPGEPTEGPPATVEGPEEVRTPSVTTSHGVEVIRGTRSGGQVPVVEEEAVPEPEPAVEREGEGRPVRIRTDTPYIRSHGMSNRGDGEGIRSHGARSTDSSRIPTSRAGESSPSNIPTSRAGESGASKIPTSRAGNSNSSGITTHGVGER